MQPQRRFFVSVEARGDGIGHRDTLANIDNPICPLVSLSSTVVHVQLTAAPPAIVPSNIGLISITFLTVCEAIQFPAVALESVATMIPPLNLNAKVVVPCASLIGQLGFE